MMRKQYLFFLMLFVVSCFSSAYAKEIKWYDNYEAASQASRDQSKPMVLFFTGSDWCGWCHKLESESLDTKEFSDAVGDKFIFVKLDYPMKRKLDEKTTASNQELKKRYDVRGFPTLIILDRNQKQIGVTGYKAGGGRQYGEHLNSMIQGHSAYNSKMDKLGSDKLSSSDLKELYRKTQEYNYPNDAVRIVNAGVNTEDSHYFQIERYRLLGKEGRIHDKEALALKEELLKNDPENAVFTHYEVACIEFKAYYDQMRKENYSADLTVAPLVEYVQKFGEQDDENSWRVQMLIAQVYQDNNQKDKAIHYAQCAKDCAPRHYKDQITSVIADLN